MKILTAATNKNTNKGSGLQLPTPSLSSSASKDLTYTVIILQRSSDRITKYVEQKS